MIEQLPATELRQWLDDKSRTAPVILDVREPWEHEVCRIAGAQLLPMQQVPAHLDELPRDRDIVVMCHHGMRSLQVADFLKSNGLDRVFNLDGGIAAWAEEVEPAMPQY